MKWLGIKAQKTIAKPYKLGLCLSGGGARGIAHAGVLAALAQADIVPDALAGASMGAIVGAFAAEGLSPTEMLDILSRPRVYKAFSWGLPTEGLTDLSYLKKLLRQHIAQDDFAALQKPLFVSVSNLNTGKFEIISEGKLSTAVLASSAIPLIFKPVRIKEHLYADGGLLNNLPAEPLREHCEIVVGVNVNQHLPTEEKIEGWWSISERAGALMIWENVKPRLALCDVVIDVAEAHYYGVFDFQYAERIFEAGYQAALGQVSAIRQALHPPLVSPRPWARG